MAVEIVYYGLNQARKNNYKKFMPFIVFLFPSPVIFLRFNFWIKGVL